MPGQSDSTRSPIESLDEVVEYFRRAETPPDDWRVGTEHEKIGVYVDSGQRVPYEGERGIGALLRRIADGDGWKLVYEGEHPIALQKEGASITLEPGGQFELSGAPLRTAVETCREFNQHVDVVKCASQDFGIAWLGLGMDPFHRVDAIPIMPKARYAIMRRYLPSRGAHALHMMHATATVQANFDYADEADMCAKLRTAMACTPVVSAIFANSSISEGRVNGFASKRLDVWRDVDPDRCGLLHRVFDEDFGYASYAEWALDVPMFFVVRDHEYMAAEGMTFRQFVDSGFRGHRATLEDWDLHLTTLFPEVRLKRFIEVRGADGSSPHMICALPALWKGILYDDQACAAVWSEFSAHNREEREAALSDVARRGLGAHMAGRPVRELALAITEIAAEGLTRIAQRGSSEEDERGFLDPIYDQLESGRSPGERIAELWEGEWQGSRDRLIEYARY